MSAFSLSWQILVMFEAHWPMKAFPSSTCQAGGVEEVRGGDLTLNSLLRTWLSLKHPPSFRAFRKLECQGQVQSVFLMDLNVSFANQEPRRESP